MRATYLRAWIRSAARVRPAGAQPDLVLPGGPAVALHEALDAVGAEDRGDLGPHVGERVGRRPGQVGVAGRPRALAGRGQGVAGRPGPGLDAELVEQEEADLDRDPDLVGDLRAASRASARWAAERGQRS